MVKLAAGNFTISKQINITYSGVVFTGSGKRQTILNAGASVPHNLVLISGGQATAPTGIKKGRGMESERLNGRKERKQWEVKNENESWK